MVDSLDAPPDVWREIDMAWERYAEHWLYEAERLFSEWEEGGQGRQVVMVLPDEDG